jgi:hypothetical protein
MVGSGTRGIFVEKERNKGTEGERLRRGPHGLMKPRFRKNGNAGVGSSAVVSDPVVAMLTEAAVQPEQRSRRESVAVHPWKRRSASGTPQAMEQGAANNIAKSPRQGRSDRVDRHERQPMDLDQRPLSELDGPTLITKGWTVSRNFGESRGMVSVELLSPDGGHRETRTIPSRRFSEISTVRNPTITVKRHRPYVRGEDETGQE